MKSVRPIQVFVFKIITRHVVAVDYFDASLTINIRKGKHTSFLDESGTIEVFWIVVSGVHSANSTIDLKGTAITWVSSSVSVKGQESATQLLNLVGNLASLLGGPLLLRASQYLRSRWQLELNLIKMSNHENF